MIGKKHDLIFKKSKFFFKMISFFKKKLNNNKLDRPEFRDLTYQNRDWNHGLC
jgi:hypothetical protein